MKHRTYILAASTALIFSACVSTNADVPRGHPANPASPTAPLALTPVLTAVAATTDTQPVEEHQMEGMGHHHHDAAMPAPPATATPPKASDVTKQADAPAAAEVWTCTMHPQVAKSGPGQCPICGMNLVKRPTGKDAK